MQIGRQPAEFFFFKVGEWVWRGLLLFFTSVLKPNKQRKFEYFALLIVIWFWIFID